MRDEISFSHVVEMAYLEAQIEGVEPWVLPTSAERFSHDTQHSAQLAEQLAQDGLKVVEAAFLADLELDFYKRRLVQMAPSPMGWALAIETKQTPDQSVVLAATVLDLNGRLHVAEADTLLDYQQRQLDSFDRLQKLELLARSSSLEPLRLHGHHDYEFQRARLASFMVQNELQLPEAS